MAVLGELDMLHSDGDRADCIQNCRFGEHGSLLRSPDA
jgi:hypothetical protein